MEQYEARHGPTLHGVDLHQPQLALQRRRPREGPHDLPEHGREHLEVPGEELAVGQEDVPLLADRADLQKKVSFESFFFSV